MARACTVCSNPNRESIDRALVEGTPNRRIASQYDVTERAVRNHKANHLPAALAKSRDAREVAEADDLLGQVRDLQARTLAILEAAETTSQHRTALSAIREARSNLELLAKLVGELDERPVNVLVSTEWLELRAVIVTPWGRTRRPGTLSRAGFARAVGLAPDPWQERLLRSDSPRLILNCCRQAGKSTVSGVLALHTALYRPGSLVLVLAPSLRHGKAPSGARTGRDFVLCERAGRSPGERLGEARTLPPRVVDPGASLYRRAIKTRTSTTMTMTTTRM